MNFKKMTSKVLAVLMAMMLIVGACAPAVVAVDPGVATTKPSYVSLGASNVNGYGLRGYISSSGSGYADAILQSQIWISPPFLKTRAASIIVRL